METTLSGARGGPDAVELRDCPECLSAGSVRRGVCDICGRHVTARADDDLVPA
jgi:hypothetical protein